MYYSNEKLNLTYLNGILGYSWSMQDQSKKTVQFYLNSKFDYSARDVGYNLRNEIITLKNDYDRVNKNFSIFRINNENFFYSDGNTKPWIIVSHFILEVLNQEVFGVKFRDIYLKDKSIEIVNINDNLDPRNIKIGGTRMLSDIIIEIFEKYIEVGTLNEYLWLYTFCNSNTKMDDLFSENTNSEKVKNLLNDVIKLTLNEQHEFMKLYIEELKNVKK